MPRLWGFYREDEKFLHESAEAVKVRGHLLCKLLGVGGNAVFRCQIDEVGEALKRVVDLVGELVGHGCRGGSAGLLHEETLLGLLADGKGGEVGENLHELEVAGVEGLGLSVGEDPDGSMGFAGVPRQEDAVGGGGGFDVH